MNEDYRTMHIPELAEVVKYYKTTLKGRETMNELQQKFFERKAAEVRDEALAEGISQGVAQNRNEVVTNMIGNGYLIDEISQITGIPLDVVEAIAEKLNQKS